MNFIKAIFIFCLGALFLSISPAFAADKVSTHVKVIHASTGSKHVDPQLKNISDELNSVFKYTSYRLIKQENMDLKFGQQGQVNLPGSRTLTVQPIDMDGKRIRYHIHIRKNKKKIFQTKILLKNDSSITIGGPQYEGGVLLFNIDGRI